MLSEDVRDELAAVAPERRCDRLAEVSGLFHTAGSVHLRGGGELAFHLDLATSPAARRAFRVLRELGVEPEVRTYRQRAFAQRSRYQVHLAGTEDTLAVLREAGVLSAAGRPRSHPPLRLTGRRCCRGAYLRGALLGAGSVTGPRSAHLEVRFQSVEAAAHLARVTAPEDVALRVRERPRHAVAYAKGLEAIVDALALAGAGEAALRLDEDGVVAAARAEANRAANADHANLVRTSRAAHAQLRAIRALAAADALDRLPPRVREVAELRRRHPTLPLSELAARCRPPATKAAVQRALATVVRLAEGTERPPAGG